MCIFVGADFSISLAALNTCQVSVQAMRNPHVFIVRAD
jgi:hypothetical protein